MVNEVVGLDKQREAFSPDKHCPSEVADDDFEAAPGDFTPAEQGSDAFSQSPEPLVFDGHEGSAKLEANEFLVQACRLELVDGEAQASTLRHDSREQVVETIGVVPKDREIVNVRGTARGLFLGENNPGSAVFDERNVIANGRLDNLRYS